ncbi:MAG: hypothetical protein ACLUEQ_00490 [Cloacibacillus evryensis]
MKRILTALFIAAVTTAAAYAGPSLQSRSTLTQPDGGALPR